MTQNFKMQIGSFLFITCILITSCTKNELPKLTTDRISEINQISAKITGTIEEEGESSLHYKGFCWSKSPNPTLEDSKTTNGYRLGEYTAILYGLSANTKYYVRAYATNSNGTSYGNELSFTTSFGSIVDSRDGTVYKIITIGTQTWIAENLKATKLNDGTNIPIVTDELEWSKLTTPAYCYYLNDASSYGSVYGCLYNWQTVNSGKLCPEGWHAPSENDFVTLVNYLGGEQKAGGKLKSTGTMHWMYPNDDATNESGFSALPGGYRSVGGVCGYNGMRGNFWTTTEDNTNGAKYIDLNCWGSSVFINPAYKNMGLSVRCIKN